MNRSAALAAAAVALLATAAGPARAAEARGAPPAALGQKRSVGPDAALEGSLEAAKKPAAGPAGPALPFEQFRAGIEVKLSDKRREEIASLQKLIKLSSGADKDTPSYYFRLAELLWEESQFFFFEANRKDGQLLELPKGDRRLPRLQAEKADAEGRFRDLQKQAVALYKAIIVKYPKYERLDEVLFFLARNLLQRDRTDAEAMKAYRALIQKFPESPYVPDAWMAFGEFYFDKANKSERNPNLKRALEAYKNAAAYQESSVYGYALYKQGWVQFNLGAFADALDLFRAVVYFGELPTSTIPADRKLALVKEARKDYVRTWPHVGSAEAAFEDFRRVGGEEGSWEMLKTLADLYWTDGRDRDAILLYHRLIKEKPLSPDAPFAQSRIVTMAGRMGKKDLAVQQAHVFVKILEDFEASPAGKDPKNAKATAEARSTAENTLRTLALRYHNEWKKTDDAAVAGFATGVYTDYLEVFGQSPSAYEMRFFHAELLYALGKFADAADEYDRVVALDVAALEGQSAQVRAGEASRKAGKWFNDALEGALYAHEEACKALPPIPAQTGQKKRVPFAPRRELLVKAYERYVRWAPDGKLASKAAFRAAKVYYDHYTYAEAIDLFTRVALDHPEGDEAEYATNLVLDAYNELGDWRNLNGWAKRFYANAPLVQAHAKLKVDLPKVIEESSFKIIEEQEKAKDWEAAAESYLAFVRDWPATRLAASALFNASVDYARAHRVDKAMEVRDLLLQKYPGDALAPRCLYDNAEGYEAIADFDRAADAYERYFREWRRGRGAPAEAKAAKVAAKPARPGAKKAEEPAAAPAPAAAYDEKKANDAIINAAVFRAGLRDWARAEAASQAYLETWPDGADAARLSLSLADLAARQGQPAKELARLRDYQGRYAKPGDDWLAAQLRIAKLLEKGGDANGARHAYDVGLDHWRKNKDQAKDRGLPVVAEAMLRELEPGFAEYKKLDLDVPQKDITWQLNRIGGKLKKLEEQYGQVVKLGVAEPAVCALERIGRLYERFARVFLDAPVPKEIKAHPEYLEEYKAQLAEKAEPLQQKADEGLELAVTKARELGVKNDCADRATASVVAKKPELGPSPEALPALAVADLPDKPAGNGLLAAVEPVSAAPRAAGAARKAESSLPSLKLPGQKRGQPKAAPEPVARPARPEEPLPRPKKGDDEDLLP
ncbi:MAG TPA: tetratricopeptide repeat protein [Anaeromyxobacteraceae bacterium]|nr:tetratricopeptide repeat protein [Anaeromyxobacteraceae bacterium]